MLAWVVIFRSTHRQPRKSGAISLFCSASLRSPSHIHYVLISVSLIFQVPYPASPLLATLTNTAGVYTNSSQFGARSVDHGHISQSLIPFHLSLFFSHSSTLFCAFLHSRKTQLFSFQPLAHSLSQNTGGVYPLVPPHSPPHARVLFVGSHRAGPPHFRQTLVEIGRASCRERV